MLRDTGRGGRSRTSRLIGPLALLAALGVAAGEAAEPAPRTLYVVLDAVPFDLLEELTDPERAGGPLFEEFAPPVRLLSTFPSTTTLALGAAFQPLGLQRSPGYEARFFDWQRLRARGGGPRSYFEIEFPWRGFFDWTRKRFARSAVASLYPARASERRAERVVADFLASEDPEFFAYIETTDTAAHLLGPRSLESMFETLDRVIATARRDHPEERFRVVVLSDHGIAGGEPLVNVFWKVKRSLKGAGLDLRKKLDGADDVVLTPYGLVSSFELYVGEQAAARTATAVAAVEGVELCVRPAGTGWLVESAAGQAAIERRGDSHFSYRPLTGDPLDYAPVLASLAERAGREFELYPDAWWLEATREHRFPDALSRISRTFALVSNPASIVCSVAPGHMFGLKSTENAARIAGGRLRWTHGALDLAPSSGFALVDDPAWSAPEVLRISDLMPSLAGAPPSPVAAVPIDRMSRP